MQPLRAFLLSFAAGLVVLFGGYSVAASMMPARTDHVITV